MLAADAQTPAPATKDPLGRTTPQEAIFQFLEACHAHQYSKAAHYLDLHQMSPADREKNGPELAQQPGAAVGQNVRQACRADYSSFCSGVQPGGDRILACLKQNVMSLPPDGSVASLCWRPVG